MSIENKAFKVVGLFEDFTVQVSFILDWFLNLFENLAYAPVLKEKEEQAWGGNEQSREEELLLPVLLWNSRPSSAVQTDYKKSLLLLHTTRAICAYQSIINNAFFESCYQNRSLLKHPASIYLLFPLKIFLELSTCNCQPYKEKGKGLWQLAKDKTLVETSG